MSLFSHSESESWDRSSQAGSEVSSNNTCSSISSPCSSDTEVNTRNVDAFLQNEFSRFNSSMVKTQVVKAFRQRYARLEPVIKKFGVNDSFLTTLLDLIFSQKLGIAYTIKLVNLLLPRGSVSEKHVIRIFGILSCRDYSRKVVARLLQWVITIYDLLDSTENIVKLYSVVFQYLTMETLRPLLCHLLYFMTKRPHVKAYRVRQLLELVDKVGLEPQLYGLLNVYKNYSPDISLPQSARGSKLIFTHPDPEMMENIQKIRQLWDTDEQMTLHRPILETPRATKRRKRDNIKLEIPDIVTTKASLESVTLTEIADVTHLAENIDKLELPDRLAAILENRMLQHFIVCHPEENSILRISFWLNESLLNLLQWNNHTDVSKTSFQDLLRKLIEMSRLTKAHFPVVESFLREYIKIWNGVEYEDEIFELLTFVKPEPFEDLYTVYLKPLYDLYCVSDVTWKARLILCYTEWLKNWVLLDWKVHAQRRRQLEGNEMDEEVDDMIWLFQGLSLDVDYFQTMQYFIQHVDRLGAVGLAAESDSPVLQHAVFSFFELVSSISTHHDVPENIIPAAAFVYRSFFSLSGMAVSRICGIIYQYKRAFEENDQRSEDWMIRHTKEYLDHFNTYVMDICNALWRNLALSRTGPNDMAFSMTEEIIEAYRNICETRDQAINSALSVTHSAALANFSRRFMMIKEEEADVKVRHDGPITPQMLKFLDENEGLSISYRDYRVQLLDYLQNQGLTGIYDLLYSSMNSLIERRRASDRVNLE